MENPSLFDQYADTIRNLRIDDIQGASSMPASLELARDGKITVDYIPFDYVNPKAKIVLVGITPGFTQARNALMEAQKQLKAGATNLAALQAAKETGAFSGSMRPNLVAMLDYLKINDWLGIKTCDDLFGKAKHLVQSTSALRFPVFVDGENYNGTPNMTRHPLLQGMLKDYFAQEAVILKDAIFIPLGPKVSEAIYWLSAEGMIQESRILDGMPHPSGANAERIAYFLGRKPKSQLSVKTDPDKIDNMKKALITKISTW